MTVDEITKIAAEVMTSEISQKGARFVLPEPMLVELANRIAAQARQREWVGLTDEERDYIWEKNKTKLGGWDHGGDDVMYDGHFGDAVIAIEAKLKEKNT